MRIARFCAVLAILCQLQFVAAVKADWNPGDPAKWVQLPNLVDGMDVYDTFSPALPYNKILADDFLCTQTGPITSIHIWGSWLNDHVPKDPASGALIPPLFDLSFHADVPAGVDPTMPWSHPGPQLWDRVLVPNQMRIYATGTERFFDPNINQVIGPDTQVWQYNFFIPPTEAFFQNQGTIYWLNVQVQPQPPVDPAGPFVFGWKTSIDHFNDDAVFGDNDALSAPPPLWRELRDPFITPPRSLDLAFVLDTIPEPASFALVAVAMVAAGLFGCRRNIR